MNNHIEAGGILSRISAKELLKIYPLDEKHKERARGFLNRIEKLVKDYRNYPFFKDEKSGEIKKVKIIGTKIDHDKIIEAKKIGYKFFEDLESFHEKTKQEIETHIDDRLNSDLNYNGLQERAWLVAYKIAEEKGRGKAFLEVGSSKTFIEEIFFSSWSQTAKRVAEIEVVNDHPYLETNPLAELLNFWEIGASWAEFKRDDSKKEFLGVTFFIKKGKRIVGKELRIYPKVNKDIPQA